MLGYALGQKKVPRHRFATLFHLPLYAGFVMLLIGTTLLAIAEWTEIGSHIFLKEGVWFHKGLYYILYEVTLDLFGLGVIFGCILALWRRHVQKPASVSLERMDGIAVWLLLLICLNGYALESARLAIERNPEFMNPPRPQYAQVWSFVGYTFSPLFEEYLRERLSAVVVVPLADDCELVRAAALHAPAPLVPRADSRLLQAELPAECAQHREPGARGADGAHRREFDSASSRAGT
jgi:hypothetical protein